MRSIALRSLRCAADYVGAAGKYNFRDALAASHIKRPDAASLQMASQVLGYPDLANVSAPSYDRSFELHYFLLAERRMAALALAIRLYQIDHGRRPEELAELVPEYLSAVPLDPLAGDGRVLAYKPDADPPILYSVGRNGVDEGGTYALHRRGNVDLRALDIPHFLDGNRPRPTDEAGGFALRSTAAGKNQTNKEDGGREPGQNEPAK